jgi:hydroxymethylpyrimidine/phosphomethylpyrimidine kinase
MSPLAAPPLGLTVAGLDPSGGAGIIPDIATLRSLSVQPAAVAAAITVQNSQGVLRYQSLDPALVRDQVEAVLADMDAAAVKTGMLGSAENVRVVAELLAARPGIPLVVDPVLIASSGDRLAGQDLLEALHEHLLPRARVVTPNLDEAAALAGLDGPIRDRAGMSAAAARIAGAAGCAVLLTGGHGSEDTSADLLHRADGKETWLEVPRATGPAPRGTGCRHSAAVAAGLARGLDLCEAAARAQAYLAELLARPRLTPGRGAPHLDDLGGARES